MREYKGLEIDWEVYSDPGNRENPPCEEYTFTARISDLEELECAYPDGELVKMFPEWGTAWDASNEDQPYSYTSLPDGDIEIPGCIEEELHEHFRSGW